MKKRTKLLLIPSALLLLAFAIYTFSLGTAHFAMAFVPPPPSYQDQVDSAVTTGRAWLLTQQTAGCWTSTTSPSVTTGVTALAMLAIIHSEPTGYAGLDPASKAAVDAGTTCLLNHVITTGPAAGTIDDAPFFLSTYNTSISIWSLSEVPSSPAIASAIAGGRAWLRDNQRNCNDPPGRPDLGGNPNNGGWYYEGGVCDPPFVEHSNSSFALQGLAATAGGIPAATADLAQGYFTCLQRRVPHCGPSGFNPDDGGFIYEPYNVRGNEGGSGTAPSASGTFALLLTGVTGGDPRISDGIAFLDASLTFSPCTNNAHNNPPSPNLAIGWSVPGPPHDTHYTLWANFKAHELAGIPPDLNNMSNYYFKLTNCLTNEQVPDGHFPPVDSREDNILATSFALLTLEKVAPGPAPHEIFPAEQCCGEKPHFTDPAYMSVFTGQVAVSTYFGPTSDDFVLEVVDLKNQASAPLNANYAPPIYHGPASSTWTQGRLGEIFGVTLDEDGNIYVTATTAYNGDSFPAGATHGEIYKINGATGAITTFQTLSQHLPAGTGAGLGNIAYDCTHRNFYVSNIDDGLIYRLDLNGNILSTWDHGHNLPTANPPLTAIDDTPATVFTPLGRRVWGLQAHNGRLYYGVWWENSTQPDPAGHANEVWSVALVGSGINIGNFVPGTDTLEITMPVDVLLSGGTPTNYSNPVSDISFGPAGTMLLAERTMVSDSTPNAHQSRALEYKLTGTVWVPTTNAFAIGVPNVNSGLPTLVGGPSSAGGVDYDFGAGGRVWATGDALQLSPLSIYGLQGLPSNGGSISNSILIDSNGDASVQDKTEIGDVEIPCPDCEIDGTVVTPSTSGGSYTYEFTVTNHSNQAASDIVILPVSGVTSITPQTFHISPALAPGQTSQIYTITLVGAQPGGQACFNLALVAADGSSCCSRQVCVPIPSCFEVLQQRVECLPDNMVRVTVTIRSLESYELYYAAVIPSDPSKTATDSFFELDPPVPPLGITTISTIISPVAPGETVFYTLTVHYDELEICCSRELSFTANCPTPTPSGTITPAPTATPTAAATPTITPAPTPTPSGTRTPTPTPSGTRTPTPTATATATTPTPSGTRTPTPTATQSPGQTITPTPSPLATTSPTATPCALGKPAIVTHTGNNSTIATYDFATGGPPFASFATGNPDDRGRGVEVVRNTVYYTSVSGDIHRRPYNNGLGGPELLPVFPNPRPGHGIQDLDYAVDANGTGILYALTGYLTGLPIVYALNPVTGSIISSVSIQLHPDVQADGFTVLPNGDFLINNQDASPTYRVYDHITGSPTGSSFTVPSAVGGTTGVDLDPSDNTLYFFGLFCFACGGSATTEIAHTDLSGVLLGHRQIVGGSEDISVISCGPPTPTPTATATSTPTPTPSPASCGGVTLTLDDDAATSLPDNGPLVSGTFKPTNFPGGSDTFPPGAPPPGGSALTVFNGANPNGMWSLFVVDDASGDVGRIAGGWELNITTTTAPATSFTNLTSITIPAGAPGVTQGAATPYPSNIIVTGLGGMVTKVTVKLNCICHTFPDDIDIMLVGPGGQNALIMSDVGGSSDVGPCATPTPTPIGTAPPGPINLSTRLLVQPGDNVGIGGLIITGTVPKHAIIRAIGPSLTPLGVPNALADPVLELHGPGAFATITNANWRDDHAQEAAILATGLAPTNNLESAIDATLNPGAYTAVVRGQNNTSGVALIEIYDLSQAVLAKLANLSTRAFVGTGDNIAIAGFILGGQSGAGRIALRGVGPSLTAVGVTNALADPTLELRDGNGALLIANNDWQDNPDQAAKLTAAGLAPRDPLESGIVATLPPGTYTALLAGHNNGSGVGLVELYDLGGSP